MISKKVEYKKIAAALCDFHIGEKELDLLVGVYECSSFFTSSCSEALKLSRINLRQRSQIKPKF